MAVRTSPAALTNTPNNSGSNKRAVSSGAVCIRHSGAMWAPPGVRNSVPTNLLFHHPQVLPFPSWSL